MIWMIVGVLVLVAVIVGVKVLMVMRMIASFPQPAPATVSATQAAYQSWQPRLQSVGSLRAVRGADLALDVAGVVDSVDLKSGDQVKKGQVLLQLRNGDDLAQLHQLEADARLARANFRRARQQRDANAISVANYDSAAAEMNARAAAVERQQVVVAKKQLRAPFAGRAGIITVNSGDFISAGTMIVTLQHIESLYADFDVPQRELGRLKLGQTVHLSVDAFPGRRFAGTLSAINARVDTATRNVQVEATVPNPDGALVPGMFARLSVDVGKKQRYLTLPQTAIVYNPYGNSVFVVQRGKDKPAKNTGDDAKPAPQTGNEADNQTDKQTAKQTVKQTIVTTGETRGDQVAILKGLQPGTTVVTSGQLKLQNDAPIKIDNSVQPADSPDPTPQEQ